MPVALLSAAEKRGLVELGSGLVDLGWDLLASDGTANTLERHGLPVQNISAYTGSPEILDGRVKTLHPAVHGGLLSRRTNPDRMDLVAVGGTEIDLVAVTLYPFEQTISNPEVSLVDALENIDIGGAALLRAGAKNYPRVLVLSDPDDYPLVLAALQADKVSLELRRLLAYRAFAHTAAYDSAIAAYLSKTLSAEEQAKLPLNLFMYPAGELRYGENPHQAAGLYTYLPGEGPLGGTLLQGKPLSYNNLLDLDTAWKAVIAFEAPAVCLVKHLTPCGLASATTIESAFMEALASDPVSAFGSVIAANRPFDGAAAGALEDLFVECIAAPAFTDEAQQILRERKQLRLLELPGKQVEPSIELRSIHRGLLRQEEDPGDPPGSEWRVVSKREPTEAELAALRFAWQACQYVKSNAIVFARGQATVGIGGGQPNRVDCVRIAARRAGARARGAVMASDAFFPFPDGIEEAARVGISAVIEPGGSIRDQEVIEAADAAGMALVFTGVRHFRH